MKNIPNKVTSIPNSKDGKATFADLITSALNVPPPGGFTPSLMRARARVDDVVSRAMPDKTIDLEDADFEVAKQAVGACPWQIRSPDLIELFNHLGL